MKYLILASLTIFVPCAAQAAVTINEIAWMGTETSANDEWIELHNDGASMSLDGWVLSDGANLSIPLSGTLSAGAYGVLERTDDSSAPGSAFLIYTGALANTGATLSLTRSDGSVADQVAGGADWQNIGGDNTTKETAQYTQSGWTTGVPTPGSTNATYEPQADQSDEENEQDDADEADTAPTSERVSSTERSSGTEAVPLVLPDVTLDLALTAPTRAYVHQPIELTLTASDVGPTILNSLTYAWNFGDLSTDSGKEVQHRYEYPGTYVVVAHAEFKRQHATLRHEITVLPVTFSITHNTDGDLQIHNDARYEVDLSGYSVHGDSTIVFPENTILLPNATLTIPQERVSSEHAFLMDQEHMIVASTMPERSQEVREERAEPEVVARETTASFPAPPGTPRIPAAPAPAQNNNFTFADDREDERTPDEAVAVPKNAKSQEEQGSTSAQTASVNQSGIPIDSEKLPYLALIGVLALGLVAVYAGKIKT